MASTLTSSTIATENASPHPASSPRAVIATLFTASLLLGAFELAITRLASVLYFIDAAYLAIALSLMALGFGAVWSRQRQVFLPTITVCLAASMPAIWMLLINFDLAWLTLSFTLPFFLFGVATTTAWQSLRDAGERRRLYMTETIGAVTGLVLLGPWLMPFLPVNVTGENGLDSHLKQTIAREGLIHSRSETDSFARTDFIRTGRDNVAYLFTDGMFVTRAVAWDGTSQTFDDPYIEMLARMKRLALMAGPRQRVLLLGAGAGFDVAVARQAGASAIDAVEVNEAIINFAMELEDWTGGVLTHPDVSVHIDEARRFVSRSDNRWDHISLTLLQTSPAAGRGKSHVDGRVLTTEAISLYLAHLSPGGVIAVIQNSRNLADRTWPALVDAAGDRNKVKLLETTSESHNPFSHLLLVRNEVWTDADERRLRSLAKRFDARVIAQDPGMVGQPFVASDDRPFLFEPGFRVAAGVSTAAILAFMVLVFLPVRLRFRGPVVTAAALSGVIAIATQILVIYRFQSAIGLPTLAIGLALGSVLGSTAIGVGLSRFLDQERLRFHAGALSCAGLLVFALVGGPVAAWCSSLPILPAATMMVLLTGFCCLPLGTLFLAVMQSESGAGHEGLVIGCDGLGGVIGSGLGTLVALYLGFSWLGILLCLLCGAWFYIASRLETR